MDLHVSLAGRRDLCGQVYRQIRATILDGRLRPGEPMPSSRELAGHLGVSRNTVGLAYDRLVAEGFLTARVGVGTQVSAGIGPAGPAGSASGPAGTGTTGSPLQPRALWAGIYKPPDMSALLPQFDFRSGMADVRSFPFDTWRALVARQLRPTAVGSGSHIDAAGHPGLRAAIARHLGVSRAVPAGVADVFVTSGSQQAIDLVARVLLEPGDLVAVEDPGYRPAHAAFAAHGTRLAGVPVDGEGLVVEALPGDARLVYVCPSHHYPLGVPMSLPRRLALLEWAERVDAAVVEDDYDSEFRYGGRPLEPLASLDHTGRVLYIGSLSKVMLPTLRLGFLVAPAPLHSALRKAKHVTDWHTAVPMQAAAAEFIDKGLLARHIRRMRRIYAERHHRISAGLQRDFGTYLAPIPSSAGLHLAALLRHSTGADGVDGTDRAADAVVARRARAAGVAVETLSRCAVTSPPPIGLMLGYGGLPTDRIDEGLRRLRQCLEDAAIGS